MEITLAFALKLKKRIISRMADLDRNIVASNVSVSGKPKLNIRALLETRGKLSCVLTKLKTDIASSNSSGDPSISSLVHDKDELIILKSLYSKIPTDEPYPYRDQDVEYDIEINKLDITAEIYSVQKKIEDIQDEIDAINQRRKIVIDFDPDEVLSMA